MSQGYNIISWTPVCHYTSWTPVAPSGGAVGWRWLDHHFYVDQIDQVILFAYYSFRCLYTKNLSEQNIAIKLSRLNT